MDIEIQDYDPTWPAVAATASADLRRRLPGVFTVIEHMGSTSVPGLPAKPVIDLMAAVPDLATVIANESALGDYRRAETGMPNRLFYFRDHGGRRTHHLHVVPADTWPTRNELILRDHLRDHPEDAARYAAVKRRLVAAQVGPDEYTRGKTELIQELMDRARADRGLPAVPVWES